MEINAMIDEIYLFKTVHQIGSVMILFVFGPSCLPLLSSTRLIGASSEPSAISVNEFSFSYYGASCVPKCRTLAL